MDQALDQIETLKPNLVVLDISLKGSNGVEVRKDHALDSIYSSLPPKRLHQHAMEKQFLRIAELLDANGHAVVTAFGLSAIGSEQAIPPGQIEAEVAVSLAAHDGVMDAVHIRRDHKPSQPALDRSSYLDVAVIEHRSRVQPDLKQKHGQWRSTQSDDDEKLNPQRKAYFNGVEPRPSCHVDVEVGVVHSVKTPESRNVMEDLVLEVDR